jgi:hypothetical protein
MCPVKGRGKNLKKFFRLHEGGKKGRLYDGGTIRRLSIPRRLVRQVKTIEG